MLGLAVALPGGDPTLAGWVVTMLEFAAAAAAWFVLRRLPASDRSAMVFWRSVLVLSLILAVNKQLDVQHIVLPEVRELVSGRANQGLRQTGLTVGVVALAALALAGLALLVLATRPRRFRVVLAGVALMLVLVILRAAEIGHVATPVTDRLQGAPTLAMEAAGALLVIIGAYRARMTLSAIGSAPTVKR
jgi:hypothetical protein